MSIEKCINDFDKKLEDAQKQIGKNISRFEEVDKKLIELLDIFSKELSQINIIPTNIAEQELKIIIDQFRQLCIDWLKGIRDYIVGKEFVNQFEKSVLVVVFGDVNVGKSSVGNIIAGTIDPGKHSDVELKTMEQYFGQVPAFYEYDLAGQSENVGAKKNQYPYFKEGTVETTANIQYFTRKGLTWTDSPGIHSVNKDNELLAKKYVEFSDLVIFITTSSSPAKYDEVKEIERLFNKKKPVLILINKSDKYEKDEVNGEIVKTLLPKSEKDRQTQECWIANLFSEHKPEMFLSVEATSISTLLALKGLQNHNEKTFYNSGFPKVYEKLGKVLSEKAVNLKMKAPKERINSAIDELINGGSIAGNKIVGIKEFISIIDKTILGISKTEKELQLEVKRKKQSILKEIYLQVDNEVFEASSKIRTGNENTLDITSIVNQIVKTETNKMLSAIFARTLNDSEYEFKDFVAFSGVHNSSINAYIEENERYVYDVKSVRRDPEGFLEWVGEKVFKKEYTEEKIIKHKVVDRYKNGDNSNEIRLKIHQQIEQTIDNYTEEYRKTFIDNYFSKEKKILSDMKTKYEILERKIEEMKIQ